MRVDDERGHPLLRLAVDLSGHLGENGEQIGVAGVRDPDLRAGEHVVRSVTGQRRRRLHGLGVRPRSGLGQAEGGNQLARRAARQILLLLCFVAEENNALAADRLMRAEIDGERRIDRADLPKDAVIDLGRRAESAVFLGNAQAHYAKRMEPLTNAVGKLCVVIEASGIDVLCRPCVERVEDHSERLALLRRHGRVREDEIFANLPEKNALREGRIDVGISEVGSHSVD